MLWRNLRRFASTSASFTYPQRIVRSPTAILEALNSCVDIDGQNPAYQYMDDPFLIPTSANEKRQFSLSKASGKKAARWIMDRYPDAFFYNTAVPPIPSYFPSYSFTDKDFIDVDEKTIYKLIDWNQLSKAYDVYKKCLSEQIEVSDACKYALFDVLCIYNSENPSEILATEEIWYRADLNESSGSKKSWKDNGLAEQMFEHLKQNATDEQKFRLYNSLACGLFKFNNVTKAMATIEEMRENQISLNLSTYNYLLRATSLLKETHEGRWQFLLGHLNEMKEKGISPNLQTFHAVLYTLRRSSMSGNGPTLAMSVLNEMRQCSIEPSLGTWAHVIMIFYPNDQVGSETKILPQILDEVEKQFKKNGNQLEWRDVDDGEFFFNAMFKATVNCRDIDLAKRIHRFFMTGSNIRFIINNIKEQLYYTNLFRLLFRLDTPEQVMPLWESVVPNIYSPSTNIIEDFIEFLSLWNQKEYYVRLWSDLLVMGLLDSRQSNHRLIERYFTLLTRTDQGELNENQIQQYTNIARQMIKRFPLDSKEEENNDEKQQGEKTSRRQVPVKFQYNGQLLSNLICLLSQGNDLESSFALYDYYILHRSTMVNPLTERTLMLLLKLAVNGKNIERSFHILQTINEHSYNCLGDALDLVNRSISLTQKDRQYLRTIQKNATVESAHQVKLI